MESSRWRTLRGIFTGVLIEDEWLLRVQRENDTATVSGLGDFEAEIPSEEPITSVTPSANKGKQLAKPSEQPELQLRRSKRKAPASSEEAPAKQRIIFHKNRGRSERIFNQKMKKYGFGKDGEGSTPEKAFSLI
ncbi:hypothetical protein Tco_1576769 [Tanacetum coccineum]